MSCGCKHSVLTGEGEGPVLVLAEGEEIHTFACGDGGCSADPGPMPPIKAVRFERVQKNAEGAYEITEEKHVDLHKGFGGASESHPGYVPWLRPPTRNLKSFSDRLKAARELGQMTDSLKLYEALKKNFSHKEDEDPAAQEQEVFYVILLDTQLYVTGMYELARGARDRVMAPIPDVLRLPVIEGSMAFVVGHNHPSSKVDPSEADKELTKALQDAAKSVDIKLMDHIIWGAEIDGKPNYYSFYDHGVVIK